MLAYLIINYSFDNFDSFARLLVLEYDFDEYFPIKNTLTILLGILLSIIVACINNKIVPRNKAVIKAAIKNGDHVEILFHDALLKKKPVEVMLKSGISYVGYVLRTGSYPVESDVSIIVLMSGYRDEKTKRLRLTDNYASKIQAIMSEHHQDGFRGKDIRVVFPIENVETVRMFDIRDYNDYSSLQTDQPVKPPTPSHPPEQPI